MQVNVLYLEKMHSDLTKGTVEKRTLQSLKVTASADTKPAIGHTCVLLTHHGKKFQRKIIFREKGKKSTVANACLGMSEDGSLQFHIPDTVAVIKKDYLYLSIKKRKKKKN